MTLPCLTSSGPSHYTTTTLGQIKMKLHTFSRRLHLTVFVSVLLLSFTPVLYAGRPNDWLIDKVTDKVELKEDANHLTLTNGQISRTFTTLPSFGTVSFRSESKERSILRTILPEGFVTLDGFEYPIGGLEIKGHRSYLNSSEQILNVLPFSFQYVGCIKASPKAPYHWEPGLRHSPSDVKWPPEGLTLVLNFKPPEEVNQPSHSNIVVSVNYEMYVGVPILAKWITVVNTGTKPVTVNKVVIEYLGTQKPYAPLSFSPMAQPWEHDTSALTASWLYVEANVPHGASINWEMDPSIVFSPGSDQPVLNCSYSVGPGVVLQSTSSRKSSVVLQQFDTYRVLELVADSYDRERVALSRHRMIRLLAPQTQENPIFFHGTNSSSPGFKMSVDQMAQVGFEMYIYSFGSGFALEDLNKSNIDQIARDIGYAKSKGIEVGGYDLIDLDRGHGGYGGNVGDQWDVVSPSTGKLTTDACFASGWYDKIRDIIFEFINKTGLSMLETDGPYGGAVCASLNHTHHYSTSDSVYWQTRLQAELYSDLRGMNVFINQPVNYFYSGASKAAMGYNEYQYNLGRWEDISVSRQGMYDDTFHFIPTQGWMFVPLVDYHGGGAAAEFEPFSNHMVEYEWALAQYLGYGVAACYRGPRLYDSDKTMQLVKKWVDFYKKYRDILISDIVHVRRPDMQDYDCILHVNPYITDRGLAMVFNPTLDTLSRNVSLPLYYTGISTKALILQEGRSPGVVYSLKRDYAIQVQLKMAPRSITWFVVQSAD